MWRQASLPDVEGGILPPGKTSGSHQHLDFSNTQHLATRNTRSAGLEARLYGSQGWPPLHFQTGQPERFSRNSPPRHGAAEAQPKRSAAVSEPEEIF